MNGILGLILGYAVVMLVAGIALSRNKTVQDFLVAGRNNAGFVMAAGMVIGSIDAMWFTLFSGMGYTMGWSFLWVIVGIFIAIFCLDIMAGKIKEASTAQKMLTVTDWFYHKFGPKTERIVGLIVTLNFLGWLAAVFVSAGLIISSVFDLDYTLVIITGAVIILPLLLKGDTHRSPGLTSCSFSLSRLV